MLCIQVLNHIIVDISVDFVIDYLNCHKQTLHFLKMDFGKENDMLDRQDSLLNHDDADWINDLDLQHSGNDISADVSVQDMFAECFPEIVAMDISSQEEMETKINVANLFSKMRIQGCVAAVFRICILHYKQHKLLKPNHVKDCPSELIQQYLASNQLQILQKHFTYVKNIRITDDDVFVDFGSGYVSHVEMFGENVTLDDDFTIMQDNKKVFVSGQIHRILPGFSIVKKGCIPLAITNLPHNKYDIEHSWLRLDEIIFGFIPQETSKHNILPERMEAVILNPPKCLEFPEFADFNFAYAAYKTLVDSMNQYKITNTIFETAISNAENMVTSKDSNIYWSYIFNFFNMIYSFNEHVYTNMWRSFINCVINGSKFMLICVTIGPCLNKSPSFGVAITNLKIDVLKKHKHVFLKKYQTRLSEHDMFTTCAPQFQQWLIPINYVQFEELQFKVPRPFNGFCLDSILNQYSM